MHLPPRLLVLLSLVALTSAQTVAKNPKRGLVYVANTDQPQDNYIWTRPPTTLSWYYNYGPQPSVVFNNLTQAQFEFVPMLWGAPRDPDSDTTFLNAVTDLVKNQEINITHVMGFNEPDGPTSWGGSDIAPAVAAKVWVKNIIPLQEMGIKAGLPAPTGGWDGIPWLRQFLGNCSSIISTGSSTKNCTFDFVPIHWYGPFEGLSAHIGTYAAAFPGKKIWVTEYNFNDQDLATTQQFVQQSLEYMDRITDVERYSLFGAFRSKVSNVGPNAAMLSAGGQLTDIGAWYLGRQATGVDPSSTSGAPVTGRQGGMFVAVVALVSALLLL